MLRRIHLTNSTQRRLDETLFPLFSVYTFICLYGMSCKHSDFFDEVTQSISGYTASKLCIECYELLGTSSETGVHPAGNVGIQETFFVTSSGRRVEQSKPTGARVGKRHGCDLDTSSGVISAKPPTTPSQPTAVRGSTSNSFVVDVNDIPKSPDGKPLSASGRRPTSAAETIADMLRS